MEEHLILIVDDEAGIRELIQLYLQDKGYQVITAANGNTAIEYAISKKPQLILLDIEMPGMDGFEVCKQIRKEMTVPILFLSVRRGVMDKVKCFELGGDDYITKPFDYKELEARIKANLRRYEIINPTLEGEKISYENLSIYLDTCKCYMDSVEIELSAKEFQLLTLFMEHPKRIWSTEQLYDQVWGMNATGNIETVKVHISNLRKKLEMNAASPSYIHTIRGFGYIFEAVE